MRNAQEAKPTKQSDYRKNRNFYEIIAKEPRTPAPDGVTDKTNHYREAMDGMAGGSDSDSEKGEEDGISRTPAPSCERHMRRGSAPIPTILQHRPAEHRSAERVEAVQPTDVKHKQNA